MEDDFLKSYVWTGAGFWGGAALVHTAVMSYMSWRFSSTSFWLVMLQDSLISFIIIIELANGVAARTEACDEWQVVFLLPVRSIMTLMLLAFIALHINLPTALQRMFRFRAGRQRNFLVGVAIGCLKFLGELHIDSRKQIDVSSWEDNIWIFVSSSLDFVVVLMLRNAAVYGFMVFPILELFARGIAHEICWINTLSNRIPWLLSFLIAGTCETSHATRLVLCAGTLLGQCFWTGSHSTTIGPTWTFWRISCTFALGHVLKVYVRQGRDVQHWEGAIALLKFSEVRRRRREDRSFILSRRQEMDPQIFGDPTYATYIFVVSHAWLSPENSDPDGRHLDLVIQEIEQKFASSARFAYCGLWRWWYHYYYMQAEGDMLIFFDMSSLYQHPRTPEEEKFFVRALSLMNLLYFSFPVLVIQDIPDSVRHNGYRVTFLEKGWCWAEASIARIGGQLQRFSGDVTLLLEDELKLQESHQMSLTDGLLGRHGYPSELMMRGQEAELMSFREKQSVQGKVFTNGKFDSDRVAKILRRMECQKKLHEHLCNGERQEVLEMFNDSSLFTAEYGGLTQCDLANTIFDGTFTTPLHLAVAVGDVALARFLVDNGARPRRNFDGYFPWQRFLLVPRLSAAARVARTKHCAFGLPQANLVQTESKTELFLHRGPTVQALRSRPNVFATG